MIHLNVVPVGDPQQTSLGVLEAVSIVAVVAVLLALLALGDARVVASVMAVSAGLPGAVLYAAPSNDEEGG